MNRIILQLVAVGICFAIGQALQCYKCPIGIGDVCITYKTTCDAGEHCYSGVGKAVGFVDIKMKGCLPEAECNKTEQADFDIGGNKTVYSMTKTCCNTDLCNAAPGLPAAPGFSLAFAAISALLVANFVVY